MSRIGNVPISIPADVTIDVSKGNMVTVNGPKGELKQQVDQTLNIKNEDGTIGISRPNDQQRTRAMHGLFRSLLFNVEFNDCNNNFNASSSDPSHNFN